MNDKELTEYAMLHSRTERALFAREHVSRLSVLAGGESFDNDCRDFIAVHYESNRDMLDKAYAATHVRKP